MLQAFHLSESSFLKAGVVFLEAIFEDFLLFLNDLSHCQSFVGIVKLIIEHGLSDLGLHDLSLLVKFVLVWVLGSKFIVFELHSWGLFVFIGRRNDSILWQ